MAFEIFDTLFSYGCLDLATATAIKCSSKDTVHLISTGDMYIKWIAQLIDEPLDTTSIKALASRLKTGDKDLVSRIFKHDKVFFDVASHERLFDVCFDFSSYSSPDNIHSIVFNFFKIFPKKFEIWRENKQISRHDMIVAFEFTAKLYTKLLWWGVEHFDIAMNVSKNINTLKNKQFRNIMVRKLGEVMNYWIPPHVQDRNVRSRIRANLKSTIKLIKAWNLSVASRTLFHIGSRGGIYILKDNGSKLYIK
jgi:hypothetical protein